MSTTTTDNLALIKEGSDEPVRNHRSNANSNMDAIDAAVKDLQDAIDNAKALLGSLGLDGSGDPVVSKAEALATLGAAASSHNHAAGDITSGTLAIARGGTNAGTAAAARTNLDAAQDASSGTTLYAAQQAISELAAAQGSVPSGKTLQGEIQTLQDSVSVKWGTPTIALNSGFQTILLNDRYIGRVHQLTFDIKSSTARPMGETKIGRVSGIPVPLDGATTGAVRVGSNSGTYDGICQFIGMSDGTSELRVFSSIDNAQNFMGSVIYFA